jgi:hypothetical protein
MRTLSRYEQFDRDAEQHSEALVVNVSPYTARFEIAGTQGSPPRRYKLDSGKTVHIQAGYAKPIPGASPSKFRAPTIESLTERQIRPGVTLPCVVHVDRANEVREQWRRELAKVAEPPKPVKVMLPTADGGEPVEMTIAPTPPAPEPTPSAVFDDEDQIGGEIDEPPPDHDDPIEPVTVPPAAAEAKPGKKGGR